MDTDVATDRPRLDPRDALLELGRIPSDDASMAMLQRVAELAKQVIPGVAEASITLIANDKASTVAFPGPLSRDLDESLYRRGTARAWRPPSVRRCGRSPTPGRRPAGPTTRGPPSSGAR